MATKLNENKGGEILEVEVTDKLTHDDYQRLIPAFERLVEQHGKIRLLFKVVDFHGWAAGALWDDIRFDLKHLSDIERLAVIGEKNGSGT